MTLPLIDRARAWPERVAISDQAGTHTYSDLLEGSERAAARLLDGKTDLDEARIVFMVEPSFDYVRVQWAIWRAGGVAVPLCLTHPAPELEYVLDTTSPADRYRLAGIMPSCSAPWPRQEGSSSSSSTS